MKIYILALCMIFSSFIYAAKKADIELPDTMKLEGKELVLNGIGIRRATIFNVKVYVGGLYVLKKSQDAKVIVAEQNPKHITMKFVRDVDADDLQDGWLEGFKAAVAKTDRAPLMSAFTKFNATMKDLKEGESILINFLDQGVQVSVKGQKYPFIGDKAFAKALLSVWFINARDELLRDELLGKK